MKIERINENQIQEDKLACAQNALPEKCEQLSYPDFLNQRRILIVQIVMKAYEKLCK